MNFNKQESLYWCFTLHSTNGEDEKRDYEREYPDELAYQGHRSIIELTYTVAQEELCPESKKYHLQGYCEFKKKIKGETLKGLFSKRINWSVRRRSADEAANYCKKEDSAVKDGLRWEKGELSKTSQGKRTDLDAIKEMVLSGGKRKAIAMEHFGDYVRYHKGIHAAAEALDISLEEEPPIFRDMQCHILFGEPGSGKSLGCMHKMGDESFYCPETNGQGLATFETYNKEKWIFLDDFNPKMFANMEVLKRLMDNKRCRLPGRGANSSKWAWHTGVVISTNMDPTTWTEGANQETDWAAISRRCQFVWHCRKTHWTIIGGTENPIGSRIDSPLEMLKEWATKKQQDGAGQMEPVGSQESPIDLR